MHSVVRTKCQKTQIPWLSKTSASLPRWSRFSRVQTFVIYNAWRCDLCVPVVFLSPHLRSKHDSFFRHVVPWNIFAPLTRWRKKKIKNKKKQWQVTGILWLQAGRINPVVTIATVDICWPRRARPIDIEKDVCQPSSFFLPLASRNYSSHDQDETKEAPLKRDRSVSKWLAGKYFGVILVL